MNLNQFEQLSIWQQMIHAQDVRHQEITMVTAHLEHVLPLMECYVNAFPKYTLHNQEHIYNVVQLMGKLLGKRITQLTGLECAMLILSAAYHDAGMVFSNNELGTIQTEEAFLKGFLEEFPRARLDFEENGRKVSGGLAEWYCRWRHASRVWLKLEDAERKVGRLEWNGVPFRPALGYLCESHNQSTEFIKNNEKEFDIRFLNKCDIRFCALLLRIADILDFDNSRSPQSVYEFLELDNPKNHAEMVSDQEWRKHLASRGFQFPEYEDGSPLFFTASPRHPAVEQGIRNFLDIIDGELLAVQRVVDFCSPAWKNFKFPGEINRKGIVSDDYRSGKYQFSLSEDKILELLMGENLYNDASLVFVRELLQNAMDTVRHRVFIEQLMDPSFAPTPIEVSYFTDKDGFYWIRIDDYGMGMNEQIIQEHFLKKGNSYYQSDRFKLEKLKIRQKAHSDFVPISRFGIGLLSCFITCDKLEISTYYYYPEGTVYDRTRITIEGGSGFSVIRSAKDKHIATEMPAAFHAEDGYRTQAGTSIACRIKTSREFYGLNVLEILEGYLLAPEIPVIYKGKCVGGDPKETLETPWCKHEIIPLEREFVAKAELFLGVSFPEGIKIELRPVNITANSLSKNLAGQMAFVIPRIKAISPVGRFAAEKHVKIEERKNQWWLVLYREQKGENNSESREEIEHDISYIVSKVNIPPIVNQRFERKYRLRRSLISHNGIEISDAGIRLRAALNQIGDFETIDYDDYDYNDNYCLVNAIFAFKDDLLPDVVVSRSRIKSYNPGIVSHILYGARELNEFMHANSYFNYFPRISQNTNITVKEIAKLDVYEQQKHFWSDLPCIISKKGELSINELIAETTNKSIKIHVKNQESSFYENIIKYMIQVNFKVTFHVHSGLHFLNVTRPDVTQAISSIEYSFAPLMFMDASFEGKLLLPGFTLNKNHRLMKWLFKSFDSIEGNCSYYGRQLIKYLVTDFENAQAVISLVNGILERLRILLPDEFKPPYKLNLTLADIEKPEVYLGHEE